MLQWILYGLIVGAASVVLVPVVVFVPVVRLHRGPKREPQECPELVGEAEAKER